MIVDIKYGNYNSKYSINNNLIYGVCFGKRDLLGELSYITYYFPKKIQKGRNYCFMGQEDLVNYFYELSKFLGFKIIYFTSLKEEWVLQIKVISNSRYFLYISTYIRYVYEGPFSFLLYCAWKNRQSFPEINITHIIQFYIGIFYSGTYVHCIGYTYSKDIYIPYNFNAKCYFNILRENFNNTAFFLRKSINDNKINDISYINTKQLPELVLSINNIANRYYNENKKDICSW